MFKNFYLLLVLTISMGGASAQKGTPDPGIARKYAALEAEFRAAKRKVLQSIQTAKSPEEQVAIAKKGLPKAKDFCQTFWEFSQKDKGGTYGAKSLFWIVYNNARGRFGVSIEWRDKALKALQEDYLKLANYDALFEHLLRTIEPEGMSLVKALIKNNPNRAVQAEGYLALGRNQLLMIKLFHEIKTDTKLVEQKHGKNALERLQKVNLAIVNETAREAFKRIIKDYADVPKRFGGTMGEEAKKQIFRMDNLMIGAKAPEIVGKDMDGTPFKLSDNQGKVVLLTFWGHW